MLTFKSCITLLYHFFQSSKDCTIYTGTAVSADVQVRGKGNQNVTYDSHKWLIMDTLITDGWWSIHFLTTNINFQLNIKTNTTRYTELV